VADEDGGAVDAAECPDHHGHVALRGVETVLRGDHLVAVGLQRADQLAEARAIGQRPWQKTMLGFDTVCSLLGGSSRLAARSCATGPGASRARAIC
jgi:hypothetical protein